MKFTPKTVAFIAIAAILAWVLYSADVADAKEKAAVQRSQLIDNDCWYFDGFNSCTVNPDFCDADGRASRNHLGFCDGINERSYNRAAIGDTCDEDDDCDSGEFCDDDECVECDDNNDCPNFCYRGVCIECLADDDCASTHCLSNGCVECEENNDCAANLVCDSTADCVSPQFAGQCQDTVDCDGDDYCDVLSDTCIDPEHVPTWSTTQFDQAVTDDFKDDWDDFTQDINFSKKWLWYTLFVGGVMVTLGLLFPGKRRFGKRVA